MSAGKLERFEELCREAATELGVDPTSEIAVTLATYRLARTAIQARLIGGGTIDTSELLRVDEAIKLLKPPVIPKVPIEIIGTCIHCDRKFDVNELAPDRSATTTGEKPTAPTLPPGDPHLPHPAASAKPTAFDPLTDRAKRKRYDGSRQGAAKAEPPPPAPAPVACGGSPTPAKRDNERGIVPAHDFHQNAPVKGGANDIGVNPYLGAFPATHNEFAFETDPGHKPRTGS